MVTLVLSGWGLVFFIAFSLVAVVLFVWMLCAAASDADDRLAEMFRERACDEIRRGARR